jgi:hypothetical protein
MGVFLDQPEGCDATRRVDERIAGTTISRYSAIEDVLNQFGTEGWEAVSAEGWEVLLNRRKL